VSASPAVSIVVVARDRAALTLRCLTALAKLPNEPSFEVVLVDDGSRDETPALLGAVEGDLVTLRNDTPTGFARSCDRAVAASSGECLVLLHDDAVPCDGWLEALTATLASDPELGAVLPRSIDLEGAFMPDPHWLALAVRRAAYERVAGFAGTARAGRAEKATLLEALGEHGRAVAQARDAILLLVPEGG
jgi:glycosyltransferase involved in cell wall biosynthesis